jgi:prophage DNA circulation protein
MAWQDRLKTAAYTSPNGTRFEFDYEDVSQQFNKRTAAFSFAGVDGQYIQDNGFGSDIYPMRVIFWGEDYDAAAAAFIVGLKAGGIGKLEHPLYGTFNVVPFGTIRRRDDLKSSGNQAVIDVAFWTTTGVVYPTNQLDAQSQLNQSIETFTSDAAGAQFAALVDVRTALAQQNLATRTEAILQGTQAALGEIAATTTEANNAFRDAQDAINFSLDVLVGQPLQLAQQVANLISLPARATVGITDRVLGYASFAQGLIDSAAGNPADATGANLPRTKTNIDNDFQASDLSFASAINGLLLSLVETQFGTRTDAQAAAASALDLFNAWIVWRETGFAATGQIDGGTSYQNLQQSTALASGFIIDISFNLLPEQSVVIDRSRTLIDLCAELYQTTSDARLNELINNNKLTGSEIIELPRGTEIVYYV